MLDTKVKSVNSDKKKKRLSGVVVSNSMKDPVVVRVDRYVKHPKYGKYYTVSKRFKADDKGNTKAVGEIIEIEECPPISKDKRFRVI